MAGHHERHRVIRSREPDGREWECDFTFTTRKAPDMSSTGEFVLGTEIAAVIAALHTAGVLPIASVIDQMSAAKAHYTDMESISALEQRIDRLRMLSDALGPFQPPP